MAGLITTLIVIPLVGALLVSATRNYARALALVFNLITATCAFVIWRSFDPSLPGLQLVERHSWMPAIGAEYLVGIDGLSLLLVVLTSLVFPFALLAQKMDRGFCALMLITQAALYGTFTAQNFVLWFLFYEMSLIPAFLLIKIWGGEKRDRAATKFFALFSAAWPCCSPFSEFILSTVPSILPVSPGSERLGICCRAISPGSPSRESFLDSR
jgi:NADH-quinone oxidoreductase subunit M